VPNVIFRAYGIFGTNRAHILPQDYYYLQKDRNELPHDQRHLKVPLGVPEKISIPMEHSVQNVYLYCAYINTISKRNEMSFHFTHIT
jgi:hypothetical protein